MRRILGCAALAALLAGCGASRMTQDMVALTSARCAATNNAASLECGQAAAWQEQAMTEAAANSAAGAALAGALLGAALDVATTPTYHHHHHRGW